MPRKNPQRRSRAHTLPNFCVVLCIFVLFYILFVLCCSLYCLCVYVYWTTATGWLFSCRYIHCIISHLTGALYVNPLWFYKRQHDNRVRSKLSVACQRWWFQWRFATVLVNCAPSGEINNYCTPHIIKENFRNFLIHRCNYILLKCIVYDKLLKPRQSFWITLYLTKKIHRYTNDRFMSHEN
jgi:hypothetical protein